MQRLLTPLQRVKAHKKSRSCSVKHRVSRIDDTSWRVSCRVAIQLCRMLIGNPKKNFCFSAVLVIRRPGRGLGNPDRIVLLGKMALGGAVALAGGRDTTGQFNSLWLYKPEGCHHTLERHLRQRRSVASHGPVPLPKCNGNPNPETLFQTLELKVCHMCGVVLGRIYARVHTQSIGPEETNDRSVLQCPRFGLPKPV